MLSDKKIITIGIVVGEPSSDYLGAALIKSFKRYYPDLRVEGVVGPALLQEGAVALASMEKLSVMGITEIFPKIPELLQLRHRLIKHFLKCSPDIFIGVDAPEFNLTLEKKLKKAGILTVHYVSPSVWAWRKRRLKKIKKSVDLMLTLFPFEDQFYKDYGIKSVCVGHPLADEIPLQDSPMDAKKQLGLSLDKSIVALLPGSRSNELHYLGKLFIEVAEACLEKHPNLLFIVPMVNTARLHEFNAILKNTGKILPIHVFLNQSRLVIEAADVVLLASGTATLETMLLKKPMVIAYKMGFLSFLLAKCLVKIPFIGLPNLLSGKVLVPEFIQANANLTNLTQSIKLFLNNFELTNQLKKEFQRLHQQLRQNASEKAAQEIIKLVIQKFPLKSNP